MNIWKGVFLKAYGTWMLLMRMKLNQVSHSCPISLLLSRFCFVTFSALFSPFLSSLLYASPFIYSLLLFSPFFFVLLSSPLVSFHLLPCLVSCSPLSLQGPNYSTSYDGAADNCYTNCYSFIILSKNSLPKHIQTVFNFMFIVFHLSGYCISLVELWAFASCSSLERVKAISSLFLMEYHQASSSSVMCKLSALSKIIHWSLEWTFCILNFLYFVPCPPRGDKVSMLTHIYPHKPQRKIEVTICKITRLTSYYVWPNVWSADFQVNKKVWSCMTLNVLTEAKCQ